MGFYYGPSQPPDEDGEGGFKETLLIVWAVFRVLAIPLGVIMGSVVGIVVVIWLFTLSVFAGLAAIALVAGAIVARGVWEAKHPPDLR